jgi:uncharacterized protein (DUF1810 family)
MESSILRFQNAQDGVYASALRELRLGRKQGHWMWFIFPQLRGLGHSHASRYYGLTGIAEAAEYLRHPVLGERLIECTRAVLDHKDRSLPAIFGSPDDMKFGSCMTLFSLVPDAPPDFKEAIDHLLGGVPDAATIALLGRE